MPRDRTTVHGATRRGRRIPEPQRILVTLMCPIGDTLLATPALAALRRSQPSAHITVLTNVSNAGILDGNPDFDEHIALPRYGIGRTREFLTVIRRLAELRDAYDYVVNLSPISSLVTAGVGMRGKHLHLGTPALWWLWGSRSEAYRDRHTIDQYLLAIAPLLDQEPQPAQRVPRLTLTTQDRAGARRLLRTHGLSPTSVLVVMHAGGEGFNGRKRWAPERFAAVGNALVEQFGARIVLIGGPDDVPLSEEAAALMSGHATVVAGDTTLKVTAALIEAATLFIGNDSAPMHIAAAVGTPSVGIFGPSDWQEFHPVGKPGYASRVIHSDLPCSPCFRFIGNSAPWMPNPCQSRACLKAIQPEQVLAAATALLRAQADE